MDFLLFHSLGCFARSCTYCLICGTLKFYESFVGRTTGMSREEPSLSEQCFLWKMGALGSDEFSALNQVLCNILSMKAGQKEASRLCISLLRSRFWSLLCLGSSRPEGCAQWWAEGEVGKPLPLSRKLAEEHWLVGKLGGECISDFSSGIWWGLRL